MTQTQAQARQLGGAANKTHLGNRSGACQEGSQLERAATPGSHINPRLESTRPRGTPTSTPSSSIQISTDIIATATKLINIKSWRTAPRNG